MTPSNPLFAVLIYFISILTAYLINLKFKILNTSNRFETIDALRGFLAIGVFISHSNVWFQFVKLNKWRGDGSSFYNHLGETSVAFFFMITSFLFVTKLINSKDDFNWKHFFISRLFRIAPMYYCTLFIIIIIVLIITKWHLNVDLYHFCAQIFFWVIFTIMDRDLINSCELTSYICSVVVWTLAYEWLFYFSLPLISLFILKKKPSIIVLTISIIFVSAFFYKKGFAYHHIMSFVCGGIAPFLIKYFSNSSKTLFKNNFFSLIILICLILIPLFETADNFICKLLITIIFTIIALGNNLFGVLNNKTMKFLGEICYSTYLLHGIILFITFYFAIGMDNAKELSTLEFCIVIFGITPFVVLLSFIGYKFVELPFMGLAKKMIPKKNI